MAWLVAFAALLAFAGLFSVGADPVSFSSELEILAHKELQMMIQSVVSEDYSTEQPGKHLLGSFSYENCADPSKEAVVISSLDIKPDPVRLPGKLNISFDSIVKSKFGAPLTVKLTVEKKFIGLWIKVPCIDDVGSCTYNNICDLLAKKVKTCPPVLVKQGINCRCPISPAKVSLKDYAFNVNYKVPSVADGGVKVKVELSSKNTLIACMQMTMELE